jgi:type IV pilus assembly protein PilW
MRRTFPRSRLAQAGFTLIELMVSLVIGFAVVGALLAAYMASVRSTTHSDAMVQMTEDATQALNIMRSQAAMAGFSVPTAVVGTALQLHWGNRPSSVYGCSGQNFGAPLSAGIEASVACTGVSASDTFEVAYEAVADTSSNAIVGGPSGLVPLDCLGNQILPETGVVPFLYINDSKFYVDSASGSLYCYPRNGAAGAPLVDHVEALKVTYGMIGLVPNQIAFYTSTPTPNFNNVAAVTICVQVRSAKKVLDTTTAATLGVYVDCANTKTTNADGYLRRSFSTTVVLQNQLL